MKLGARFLDFLIGACLMSDGCMWSMWGGCVYDNVPTYKYQNEYLGGGCGKDWG